MIDWHVVLGTIAGILAVGAIIPYIKDIFYGSTRPNVVSWILWVLLLLISILAQVNAGASWSLIFLIGDLIGTSAILILCLIGYGYKKYGWLEGICFCLAIVAIISWQLAHQPLLAIVFAIIADFLASLPTVVKSYRDPWSEDPSQWIIICVASALGMVSTTIINAPNLIFPAYLLFINGLIGLLSFFGRRFKHKPI